MAESGKDIETNRELVNLLAVNLALREVTLDTGLFLLNPREALLVNGLHELDIPLSIGITALLSSLLGLGNELNALIRLVDEVLSNLVERSNTTNSALKETINGTLSSSLSVDLRDHGSKIASSIVRGSSLVISREELESREAGDAKSLTERTVGISITLGNDNLILILESSSEFVPVRSKMLAVTAPRSIDSTKTSLVLSSTT